MYNVKAEVKDKTLTITVDLSAKGQPSKSGKTIVLASTEGNQPIQPGLFLGLNLYRKK